jgi:hypothetical protein
MRVANLSRLFGDLESRQAVLLGALVVTLRDVAVAEIDVRFRAADRIGEHRQRFVHVGQTVFDLAFEQLAVTEVFDGVRVAEITVAVLFRFVADPE